MLNCFIFTSSFVGSLVKLTLSGPQKELFKNKKIVFFVVRRYYEFDGVILD